MLIKWSELLWVTVSLNPETSNHNIMYQVTLHGKAEQTLWLLYKTCSYTVCSTEQCMSCFLSFCLFVLIFFCLFFLIVPLWRSSSFLSCSISSMFFSNQALILYSFLSLSSALAFSSLHLDHNQEHMGTRADPEMHSFSFPIILCLLCLWLFHTLTPQSLELGLTYEPIDLWWCLLMNSYHFLFFQYAQFKFKIYETKWELFFSYSVLLSTSLKKYQLWS